MFAWWLGYCSVVALVVYCPGPMTMFSLANGLALPTRVALAGVAGGSLAYVGQLALTWGAIGLLAGHAPTVLGWIKAGGAGYFFWLAWRQWHAGPARPVPAGGTALRRTFVRGFAIAATNPKSIVFLVALFPRFLRPQQGLAAQFLLLAATYLVVQFSSGVCYVLCGGRLLRRLQRHPALAGQRHRLLALVLAAVGAALLR